MIEFVLCSGPAHDVEIGTVMFGMTASAVGLGLSCASVIPGPACNALADLRMALGAAEAGCAGAEFVATGALQRIIQRRVRTRKGTWRQLGVSADGQRQRYQKSRLPAPLPQELRHPDVGGSCSTLWATPSEDGLLQERSSDCLLKQA
jgi:hypothetical protein